MTKRHIIFFLSLFSTIILGQTNAKKLKPTSATFKNGGDEMAKFLDSIVVDPLKHRLNTPEKIQLRALVYIDELGGINKVDLVKSSGFRDIDSMFVHSFFKMPKWTPATDKNGYNCKDKQFVPLNIQLDQKVVPMFH